jgi:hypothetical protein
MNTTFKFSESQYKEFKEFLSGLNSMNWGAWPAAKQWLTFPGLPGYCLNQYQQDNGKTFVVVKFDRVVNTLYDTGKRFKVGGGRNYQPVCNYF